METKVFLLIRLMSPNNDFSPEFCSASLNYLILLEEDLHCCLYQSILE